MDLKLQLISFVKDRKVQLKIAAFLLSMVAWAAFVGSKPCTTKIKQAKYGKGLVAAYLITWFAEAAFLAVYFFALPRVLSFRFNWWLIELIIAGSLAAFQLIVAAMFAKTLDKMVCNKTGAWIFGESMAFFCLVIMGVQIWYLVQAFRDSGCSHSMAAPASPVMPFDVTFGADGSKAAPRDADGGVSGPAATPHTPSALDAVEVPTKASKSHSHA